MSSSEHSTTASYVSDNSHPVTCSTAKIAPSESYNTDKTDSLQKSEGYQTASRSEKSQATYKLPETLQDEIERYRYQIKCMKQENNQLQSDLKVFQWTLYDETETSRKCMLAEEELNKLMQKNRELAFFLEEPLHKQGIYILKSGMIDMCSLIQCVRLDFDSGMVNHRRSHINSDMELVNRPGLNISKRQGFTKYSGTTSITPLSRSDCSQYWELLANIYIDDPIEERHPVMEIGLCYEENRDERQFIPTKQHCYSLFVARCAEHSSICTEIYIDDTQVEHLHDTIPNIAGVHKTLQFGVLYSSHTTKIVFFDVKQMKVIKCIRDVGCDRPFWPMFGVYRQKQHMRLRAFPRDKTTVRVKLVVGTDIEMTHTKKDMLLDELS